MLIILTKVMITTLATKNNDKYYNNSSNNRTGISNGDSLTCNHPNFSNNSSSTSNNENNYNIKVRIIMLTAAIMITILPINVVIIK